LLIYLLKQAEYTTLFHVCKFTVLQVFGKFDLLHSLIYFKVVLVFFSVEIVIKNFCLLQDFCVKIFDLRLKKSSIIEL
jgi:hypothetical protein